MSRNYTVRAIWDSKKSIWISDSDLEGLQIEANTLEEFEFLLKKVASELITDNSPDNLNIDLVGKETLH